MGKAEGSPENWHGHVTAVSVCPQYRRIGLAGKLMSILEEVSERCVWFAVYLWVQCGGFCYFLSVSFYICTHLTGNNVFSLICLFECQIKWPLTCTTGWDTLCIGGYLNTTLVTMMKMHLVRAVSDTFTLVF